MITIKHITGHIITDVSGLSTEKLLPKIAQQFGYDIADLTVIDNPVIPTATIGTIKESQLNQPIIKALARATLDKINVLETKAGLTPTSLAAFKTEIKAYL